VAQAAATTSMIGKANESVRELSARSEELGRLNSGFRF
jgi:hypothetical protein